MGKFYQYCLGVAFYFLGSAIFFAQGNRCTDIQPFCAGTSEYVFPNSHPGNSNQTTAETGPNYGCLDLQPYPAWYYIQVADPGDLEFSLRQTANPDGTGALYDVDFVVWGPFSGQDEICSATALSGQNIVDCSYSPSAEERMTIPNALEDEIYVVLITNFSAEPGFITLQQNNMSTGSTDCSIIGSALGPDQRLCGETEFVLDATNEQASEFRWYVLNENTGNYELLPEETGPTFTVTETGNYQVTVYSEELDSEASDDVLIEFFDLPVAAEPSPVFGCRQGEEYIFDLTDAGEDLIGQNSGDYQLNFYLSQEAYEEGDPVANPSSYVTEGEEVVFAAIENIETGCESLPVELELQVFSEPDLNIDPVTILCVSPNGSLISPVSLGEDLGSDYIYDWSPFNDPDEDGIQNPVYVINSVPQQEELVLNLTNRESGCTFTYTTQIQVVAAPLEVTVEIQGSLDGGYTVTAAAVRGIGEETQYDYRLDNGLWQTNPVFTGVRGGTHRIAARESNGCGNAVSLLFRLIGYPRFFTPNQDGYNDNWNVINDEESSIKKIHIFDRFGKLLKDLNPASGGWDGTFNGKAMPEDDYWFRIEYLDPETGALREFKSHFTLKR